MPFCIERADMDDIKEFQVRINVPMDFSTITQDEYDIKDIVKIFKVPRERLRNWISLGYLKPSVQVSNARGRSPQSRHLFSSCDMKKMLLFIRLLDIGLSRDVAHKIIPQVL